MDFVWDSGKASANETKHGVPFTFVTRAFTDSHRLTWPDKRRDYGEERFIMLARIERKIYVVVYTLRGGTIRIISARKGNAREKEIYNRSLSS